MRLAWLLLPLAALASCDDDNVTSPVDAASPILDSGAASDAAADGSVAPKGTRVLGAGLDIGDPSFYSDLLELNDAGGHAVDLAFAWDQVETPIDAGPDAEADAASTFIYAPTLHAVNLALPPSKMSLALGAVAIDVGGPRLPTDLRGRSFDDATVLARFDALVDYVLDQMPDTSFDVLLVGDRVDFGGDLDRWKAFATFVGHARDHAHGKKAGLAVSFSVAPEVLARAAAAPALAAADLTVVRWPAVDGPDPDFGALGAAPAAKSIVLLGVGRPAGDGGADAVAAQAAFVAGAFRSWDQSRISRISFVFLDDPHTETVAAEAARVARPDPAFSAAYGSLGLRTAEGVARPAFDAFRGAARARGF